MWEALINVVMAIDTPTWISKMLDCTLCGWGLPVATNLTKVIGWRGNKTGERQYAFQNETGLIPTLEKKCVGRWCVARSPFDICPLACITSVRENTNQYRILRNKSPPQHGCFISLELKSCLFRDFFFFCQNNC